LEARASIDSFIDDSHNYNYETKKIKQFECQLTRLHTPVPTCQTNEINQMRSPIFPRMEMADCRETNVRRKDK